MATKKRLTQQELAAVLHVTDRTVRTLVERGHLPPADPDGRHDELRALRAFVAHYGNNVEARAARIEILKLDAQSKRFEQRERAGKWLTEQEVEELVAKLWARVWWTWTRSMSHLFHRMTGMVPQREQYVLCTEIDEDVKAELIAMQGEMKTDLKAAIDETKSQQRIDALLDSMANEAEAKHE